jgi:PAS domain S-box-containing protein
MVLLLDLETGAIVDANEAALRFYGWKREEIGEPGASGRTIFEVNTAPREVVRAAMERLAQSGSASEILQFRHRLSDGSERDVEVASSPVSHGGRTLLCSIVHDVSAQKREQERAVLVSQGLQSVLAATDELLKFPDLDSLLRRAIELGRERLGLERCAIFLVDRDRRLMRGTFALDREGRVFDQRTAEHPEFERWLSDSSPTGPGERWVVAEGELRAWDGRRSVPIGRRGWTAITLIRSSGGVLGTFHNDTAWSGKPLDRTQQELVDVYCSLLGSIIERKRAEDAQRDSERRFRLLAENATDLVGRAGADGTLLYLSPSCRSVIGFEPDELLGHSLFDYVHPDDSRHFKYLRRRGESPVEVLVHDAPTPGETSRLELRARCKSGTWVWLEVESRPIVGPDKQMAEVQFSARDISARRRAEEALRESEERFRLFMDNTPAMTFIKDADGRYQYLNATARRIYDAPLEKVLGLTNFDRLPLPVATRLRENDEQVLASGEAREFLEIVPAPDGKDRSWLTFKFPLRASDGRLSIGGVAVDITERRQFEAALSRTEQRLSTVINSSPLVLWTLDREGIFTASEGQGLQALGLQPGQIVGRSIFDVYAEHPDLIAMAQRVLAGEEFNGDLPLGDIVFQCSHRPLRDAEGNITGTLGVATDITQRRRAEEALASTIERMENLLEIEHAIRLARSPAEIADVALSRLCSQLTCCHAAVTVFNFDTGEATVLAAIKNQGNAVSTGAGGNHAGENNGAAEASTCQDVVAGSPLEVLEVGRPYPLDQIVAMLAPLVVRDINSIPLAPSFASWNSPASESSPPTADEPQANESRGESSGETGERGSETANEQASERAPVFWQRHHDGAGQANARRRSLPLIASGELVGALDLEAAEGPMPEEKWTVAREVAGQLAIAIQQARLLEQVRAGRRQLQALSHRLIEAQEAERRNLARELHDEIGQVLTAVKLNLQGVSKLAERWTEREASREAEREPGPNITQGTGGASTSGAASTAAGIGAEGHGMQVRLSESVQIVERALSQVRDLSLNLRPSLLDDLGLGAAMRWFVDRLASRLPIRVQLEIGLGEERLPPEIETACFRVAQEALTNATRHANARNIEIALRQSAGPANAMGATGTRNWLELEIRDDGQGFDVRSARERAAGGSSLGLPGMEERALLAGGRLTIESAPGYGTTLHALFPLSDE